jgi:hypothetical protein
VPSRYSIASFQLRHSGGSPSFSGLGRPRRGFRVFLDSQQHVGAVRVDPGEANNQAVVNGGDDAPERYSSTHARVLRHCPIGAALRVEPTAVGRIAKGDVANVGPGESCKWDEPVGPPA